MEDEKRKNSFYMKQQLLRLRTLIAVMMCALMGLTFAACSDDDDDPSGGNIEGRWVCSETSDTAEGTYAFQVGETIKFNSGNIAIVSWIGDGDEEYKWELKGNSLYLMEEEDVNDDHYVGTIAINGNEMTYTYKYRNWRSDLFTWEDTKTFTSKFKRP